MISTRQTLLIAAFSGMVSVMLGAFGAHALKPVLLQSGRLETFELAVRYQFYHTLALLAIGILMDRMPAKNLKLSALAMLTGIVLFSGSLYVMAIFNTTAVVFITPVGGVFLIGGWALLFLAVLKNKAS